MIGSKIYLHQLRRKINRDSNAVINDAPIINQFLDAVNNGNFDYDNVDDEITAALEL